MAVSMNTSMRSDFMISDAAMSQRMAEFDEEQAMQMAQFAKILGDVNGGQSGAGSSSDVMDDIRRTLSDIKDDEKFEQALKALDSELRSRISSGESEDSVDIVYLNRSTGEELPKDVQELAEMVIAGKLNIKDIPDDLMTVELMNAIIALMIEIKMHGDIDDNEPEEEVFNPAVAAVNEQNYSREVSDQMLSELYKIIEKHNEDQSEDKATILDGISEPVDEDETLASIVTEKNHVQSEEGVFEQIIDNIVEKAAQIEGTPVIQTQTNAVPTVNEVQNAASQAVENAAGQSVQSVQQSGQSDGAQMQLGGQAQKAESTAENTEADEINSAIESFTVKEIKTVEAPKAAQTEAATVNISSDPISRVKNASEELEMLKSAKLGKGENKPVETTTPLISDQPIVFTGADGRVIEVKPAEIVDQTMKIIEKAIEETKEQSEYSLVLNPEELGKITVKLIKAADGAVSVTIAAENAHTQRVLEQHSELMQNNLRNSGINLESWQTVNESGQDAYAQDYNGSSKNPYFRRDEAQNSDEENGDRTFADIIAAM